MRDIVIGNDSCEDFNVVLVTGTCRAGKTLLSQVIGTMKNVEWIEEPWMMMQLPIMENLGLINRQFAKSIIVGNFKELFNDNILLRNGNFRPKDLSTIWNVKEAEEIFNRLNNIQTRDEVKTHIRDNKSVFLVNLTEILPFIDLFYEAFPKLKVIHVVRNGLKVAENIEQKAWFSKESLLRPTNNQVFKKFKTDDSDEEFFMPWWVEAGKEEQFLGYGEFSKGLYYWHRILSFNDFLFREESLDNYKIVKYEDMVSEPEELLKELKLFLEAEETHKTNDRICRINKSQLEVDCCNSFRDMDEPTLNSIQKTMNRYGYELK